MASKSEIKSPLKAKFTFIDFAKNVLFAASSPMTVEQIWSEGTRMGLDKQLNSVGKTPSATLSAQLYVAAKKGGSGITAVGDKPKKFILDVSSSPRKRTGTTYSFTECAQKVLEKFGDKEPMHYREITKIAIESGWLISNGLTPEATMYAQIITEIRHRRQRGVQQRFVQCGRGFVGLSAWRDAGLRTQIDAHNEDVRKKLLNYLRTEISPTALEVLIKNLLTVMGFEDPQVTRRSGDGGIDVRGTWVVTDGVRIKMAVQVKRYKKGNNIQAPVVQNVRGSLATDERGLIITTSDFSKGARKEAEDPAKTNPISLINGEQLVRLLVENDIGISREPVDDILNFAPEQLGC